MYSADKRQRQREYASVLREQIEDKKRLALGSPLHTSPTHRCPASALPALEDTRTDAWQRSFPKPLGTHSSSTSTMYSGSNVLGEKLEELAAQVRAEREIRFQMQKEISMLKFQEDANKTALRSHVETKNVMTALERRLRHLEEEMIALSKKQNRSSLLRPNEGLRPNAVLSDTGATIVPLNSPSRVASSHLHSATLSGSQDTNLQRVESDLERVKAEVSASAKIFNERVELLEKALQTKDLSLQKLKAKEKFDVELQTQTQSLLEKKLETLDRTLQSVMQRVQNEEHLRSRLDKELQSQGERLYHIVGQSEDQMASRLQSLQHQISQTDRELQSKTDRLKKDTEEREVMEVQLLLRRIEQLERVVKEAFSDRASFENSLKNEITNQWKTSKKELDHVSSTSLQALKQVQREMDAKLEFLRAKSHDETEALERKVQITQQELRGPVETLHMSLSQQRSDVAKQLESLEMVLKAEIKQRRAQANSLQQLLSQQVQKVDNVREKMIFDCQAQLRQEKKNEEEEERKKAESEERLRCIETAFAKEQGEQQELRNRVERNEQKLLELEQRIQLANEKCAEAVMEEVNAREEALGKAMDDLVALKSEVQSRKIPKEEEIVSLRASLSDAELKLTEFETTYKQKLSEVDTEVKQIAQVAESVRQREEANKTDYQGSLQALTARQTAFSESLAAMGTTLESFVAKDGEKRLELVDDIVKISDVRLEEALAESRRETQTLVETEGRRWSARVTEHHTQNMEESMKRTAVKLTEQFDKAVTNVDITLKGEIRSLKEAQEKKWAENVIEKEREQQFQRNVAEQELSILKATLTANLQTESSARYSAIADLSQTLEKRMKSMELMLIAYVGQKLAALESRHEMKWVEEENERTATRAVISSLRSAKEDESIQNEVNQVLNTLVSQLTETTLRTEQRISHEAWATRLSMMEAHLKEVCETTLSATSRLDKLRMENHQMVEINDSTGPNAAEQGDTSNKSGAEQNATDSQQASEDGKTGTKLGIEKDTSSTTTEKYTTKESPVLPATTQNESEKEKEESKPKITRKLSKRRKSSIKLDSAPTLTNTSSEPPKNQSEKEDEAQKEIDELKAQSSAQILKKQRTKEEKEQKRETEEKEMRDGKETNEAKAEKAEKTQKAQQEDKEGKAGKKELKEKAGEGQNQEQEQQASKKLQRRKSKSTPSEKADEESAVESNKGTSSSSTKKNTKTKDTEAASSQKNKIDDNDDGSKVSGTKKTKQSAVAEKDKEPEALAKTTSTKSSKKTTTKTKKSEENELNDAETKTKPKAKKAKTDEASESKETKPKKKIAKAAADGAPKVKKTVKKKKA